jgi:hypothetical protein
MSSRQFDPAIIQSKLSSIRDLLSDLARPDLADVEVLRSDRYARHIVERILTALVELAASVNSYVVATKHGQAAIHHRNSFELAVQYGQGRFKIV